MNFTFEYMETSTAQWQENVTADWQGNSNVTENWDDNVTSPMTESGGVELTDGYYGYARKTLWKVVPPIIISWGTIGNILTILVILRQVKRSSTSVYLMALAVSDLGILYSGPLRNWLRHTWEIDIRTMTNAGCKTQLYFTYVTSHFSSLILVAVTWERAISVLMPHKVRLFCTPKRALLLTLSLLVFILCLNLFIPITVSLTGQDGLHCSPSTPEYRKFRDTYWEWIDFVATFALPFLLLLIGNIVIINQLRTSRRMKKNMNTTKNEKHGDTRSVMYLMIGLCVVFLVTMTPIAVLIIYFPHAQNDILELYKSEPLRAYRNYEYLLFLRTVFTMLSYTNASLNFILYVFSGSKFRADLKSLLICKGTPSRYSGGGGLISATGARVTRSSTLTTLTGQNSSELRLARGHRGGRTDIVAAHEGMLPQDLFTIRKDKYEEKLLGND